MTVHNGQGQSVATLDKQEGLAQILGQHLAIVQTIWQKYRLTHQTYHYIDINAGCGHNEDVGCIGSPLIFRNAISKNSLRHQAHFIEINPQSTLYLREALAGWNDCTIHTGDNCDVLPTLVTRLPLASYGMVYNDDNGIPSFDLLAQVSKHPRMQKIDILIRCNTLAIKRNRQYTGRRLVDWLADIKKNHWIIRDIDHSDKWQWTFLLGLNWDGIKEMRYLGFHKVNSRQGQRIIAKLNYTRRELDDLQQATLFC